MKSCRQCGTATVVTLDALKRPRARCPKCDRVAPAPQRRALQQVADDFQRYSPFVSEGEE